ncbi:thioesterase family protein [Cercophora newfieldiana]|uniref:Thioesterase family protein n=1 Tax=Cercophora newfieldiana TaxID=92897 RepID=A0AA39YC95_9PEZI|nr:thioesterase family protein [Cercophora newfieldiana]
MADTTAEPSLEIPTGSKVNPAAAAADSDPTTLDHVMTYHSTRCCASPIYAFLFGPPDASLIHFDHASRGRFTARLTLREQHLNSAGGIHGSVSATIVDWAGGLAIAAWDLRGATGVSVDINISYLSSARLGDEVEIEGKVERVGSNLAFTEVRIWKVVGGERGGLVASGRHTKFVKR